MVINNELIPYIDDSDADNNEDCNNNLTFEVLNDASNINNAKKSVIISSCFDVFLCALFYANILANLILIIICYSTDELYALLTFLFIVSIGFFLRLIISFDINFFSLECFLSCNYLKKITLIFRTVFSIFQLDFLNIDYLDTTTQKACSILAEVDL